MTGVNTWQGPLSTWVGCQKSPTEVYPLEQLQFVGNEHSATSVSYCVKGDNMAQLMIKKYLTLSYEGKGRGSARRRV